MEQSAEGQRMPLQITPANFHLSCDVFAQSVPNWRQSNVQMKKGGGVGGQTTRVSGGRQKEGTVGETREKAKQKLEQFGRTEGRVEKEEVVQDEKMGPTGEYGVQNFMKKNWFSLRAHFNRTGPKLRANNRKSLRPNAGQKTQRHNQKDLGHPRKKTITIEEQRIAEKIGD